ncbi:MAG: class I tRNA ligase family protein, partial [Bacteroidota bacterium]
EIGKRHNLETIDVLNEDGTMSEAAQFFVGDDRVVARKKAIKELDLSGLLVTAEEYTHSVGRSERTNAVVEPRLSLQWYVDMKSLAAPALEAVETDEVEFFPKRQKNTYRHWMENIRDWCISRQLWWGHRIPAYYYQDEVFVAVSPEKALGQARAKYGPAVELSDLRQDEDVLDTWFSSWLWPITCFEGFQSRDELDYYYPTGILVTGWDIIFLWVARMIMAGYEWEGQRPFKHVYFTGMVRDEQRRKMSKSLGNSPDALELIRDYGADGVRFGVLSSSPAGGDLLFDKKLCEQGRNFCNKMWNALRLIKGWPVNDQLTQPVENIAAAKWIDQKLSTLIQETNQDYSAYRLSDVTMKLYSFVWSDFCSWYLEMIKPGYEQPVDSRTLEEALQVFEKICIMLHPMMPFITEEIWHELRTREEGEDCIISSYPNSGPIEPDVIDQFEALKNIVSKTREVRSSKQLKPKDLLTLHVEKSQHNLLADKDLQGLACKLAFLSDIVITETLPVNGSVIMSDNEKYFLEFEMEIDVVAERSRLQAELDYARGFVQSVEKKLSNERFVNGAPEAVVAKERKKMSDGLERVRILEESLAGLN